MINIANNNIVDITIGNTSIKKVFLGDQLIWLKGIPIVQDTDGNSYYVRNYIDLDKSNGKYCSLGLYPNETDYYETKMYIPNSSRNYPFGGWSATNNNMYGLELYSNGIRFAYDTGTIAYSASFGNKTFTFKTEYNTSNSKMYFYVYNESGTLLWSNSTAKRSGTSSKLMYIGMFNNYSAGALTGTKMYYFKYYRNQVLVKNLIPVENIDTNEYCFFNTIDLTVHKSIGGTPFTGG